MAAKPKTIIIIGAGLAGSLLSIYLTRRGYRVAVYDKRSNILIERQNENKSSLNLSLCDRGFRALDHVGVGEIIRRATCPIYGRLIYDTKGQTTFQPYGNENQALYSIFRDDLNKILVQLAQQHEINFHFDEKCIDIDMASNTVRFRNQISGAVTAQQADIIFGADGAFSAVRLELQKTDRFNYSQQYMDYGYREITLPPHLAAPFVANRQAIHFWPRGQYMLMGFANVDDSFTLSLHLPLEGEPSFENVKTKDDLLALACTAFPEVVDVLQQLSEEQCTQKVNQMVTIRCSPWVYRDRIALIGDAAHAITPYYGQGANAGFEDCIVLDECLDRYGDDWPRSLREYERLRKVNTDAIGELALRNFVELCDRVSDPMFLLRKSIEHQMSVRYADKYATLYSMIAFSSIPYAEAVQTDKARRTLIDRIMATPDIERHSTTEINRIIDCLMQEV